MGSFLAIFDIERAHILILKYLQASDILENAVGKLMFQRLDGGLFQCSASGTSKNFLAIPKAPKIIQNVSFAMRRLIVVYININRIKS